MFELRYSIFPMTLGITPFERTSERSAGTPNRSMHSDPTAAR